MPRGDLMFARKPSSTASATPLAAHRARIRDRGLQRVEVQVSPADAPLVREVAAALADPARAEETRLLLRTKLAPPSRESLKSFIMAAPLDGIDLARSRDMGRDIDL